GNAPESEATPFRGAFTISMIVYAVMIAGMVDLPGNIAADRCRGMLSKLKSMPVSQFKDFLGRITAFLVFSLLAIVAVLLIGIVLGAKFSATETGLIQSIAYISLPILASSGIGLILGTLIKSEQGAVYTGIGVALITSFMSGIFTTYSQLIPPLQLFSRVYPISSSSSALIYLLIGERMAGYNPLDPIQIAMTVASSVILFAIGLGIYTRYCWRRG
ncbi:MAG: ABC transporter permease, partial [Candidatus Verstraetearchaeota archaeon]|nr:ABC transporter permease [Candidatus Verstraetearchaeota archaeon]